MKTSAVVPIRDESSSNYPVLSSRYRWKTGPDHHAVLKAWLSRGEELHGHDLVVDFRAAHGKRYVVEKSPAADSDTETRFSSLAKQWIEDTAYLSSAREIAMHPAYQQIIGMGPSVVPLVLRELEREHRAWFWALAAITGENPVEEHQRGNVREMAGAWIKWGRGENLNW